MGRVGQGSSSSPSYAGPPPGLYSPLGSPLSAGHAQHPQHPQRPQARPQVRLQARPQARPCLLSTPICTLGLPFPVLLSLLCLVAVTLSWSLSLRLGSLSLCGGRGSFDCLPRCFLAPGVIHVTRFFALCCSIWVVKTWHAEDDSRRLGEAVQDLVGLAEGFGWACMHTRVPSCSRHLD